MKKITVLLLTSVFILSPAVVFADDAQNNAQDQDTQDQNAQAQNTPNMPTMPKNFPKPSDMPALPPGIMGMGTQKTVVATSDGGIVIVEGNKITKFDSNLEVTKSIDLTDAGNTGGDKNTKN